jgi:hypothetical protein
METTMTVETKTERRTGFWNPQEAEVTAQALCDRLRAKTGEGWKPRVWCNGGFHEAWADCGPVSMRAAPGGMMTAHVHLSVEVRPGPRVPDAVRAARYRMRQKLLNALAILTTAEACEAQVDADGGAS